MADPVQTFIDTPAGIRLAVYDWGGDGAPVLLAHPTGFHGRVWAPVAHQLVDAGRHVYSFDFRGHGDSDESPDGYAWPQFADDVAAVADVLGLAGERTLVSAGHSKGAAALLLAEHARPNTFTNIWAYEPIMFPTLDHIDPKLDFGLAVGARKRRNEWSSPDEAYRSYASRPPLNTMTPESLHGYVDYGFRDRGDGVFELKCRPDVESEVYSMGPANGLFAKLADIEARVTVCVGEHSDAIPPALGRMIVDRLPHATLEIWEGRGHFGPQEDPDRAARSMLATRL
ncbi:MAG TPA: alpha/beta hydrolase [Acidimicrobiia bacterium]